MPKASSAKTRVQQNPLFVLKHGQERVLVQRPNSYKVIGLVYLLPANLTISIQLAIDAAYKHFPCLTRDSVVLKTRDLEVCDGHYVNITDESWAAATDVITSVEITETPKQLSRPANANHMLAISRADNNVKLAGFYVDRCSSLFS
jgi:hypothetical protein